MTEPKAPRKKPGPLPRYAPGKRPTLTFRLQEHLHQRLKDEAERETRSLSEEIERRIEKSFQQQDGYSGGITPASLPIKGMTVGKASADALDLEDVVYRAVLRALQEAGMVPASNKKGRGK